MSASVKSFDAIRRVREELLRFAHQSDVGLTEIDAEVRRMIDWVEHDRPGYWKERVRRAFDAVGEAKGALHRCLMYPINDEQPSCTEERAALRRAEANLDRCRQQQAMVSEWSRTLRHEMHEYKGQTAKLRQVLDVDVPKSATTLERALGSLEQYAALSQAIAPRAPKETKAATSGDANLDAGQDEEAKQ